MPNNRPTQYHIRVGAEPSPAWITWFEGSHFAPEANGETTLTVELPDQAALHGLLARLRDLGIPLLSVTAVAPDGASQPATSQERSL